MNENEVKANELLLCKLLGKRLEVHAFKRDGKIAANRMRIEWYGGIQDLSLGELKKFDNDKDVVAYAKGSLVPWITGQILPNLASQIETAEIVPYIDSMP